jgi:RNA polymerase sigma factor (sigma-70 family)
MADKDRDGERAGMPLPLELNLDSDAWQRSLPPTVWDALKGAEKDSLEYFARRYGSAICCYFGRHGLKREDAQDLTMDFIIDKVIQGNLLTNFKPGQYRFRSYLLRALRNYLIDFFRKEAQQPLLERGRIAAEQPEFEPAAEEDAKRQFICESVHDQIKQVLRLVHYECQRDGLAEHFKMFCLRHLGRPTLRWEEVGQRFGRDAQQAKNAAWTVRQRLRKAMLDEFRMRGMTDTQVLDEIRQLIALFPKFAGSELFSESWIK